MHPNKNQHKDRSNENVLQAFFEKKILSEMKD